MQVRRLGADEGEALRAVRLAALAADPVAFGSTLAREEAYGPEDWDRRDRPPGVTFVVDPGVAMVWGVPDAVDPSVVHLFGMWVAPSARRAGLGNALVEEVVAWAAARGAAQVQLTVVEGNGAAERLYARHGFRRTGASERRERDARVEVEMVRSLAAPTGG